MNTGVRHAEFVSFKSEITEQVEVVATSWDLDEYGNEVEGTRRVFTTEDEILKHDENL